MPFVLKKTECGKLRYEARKAKRNGGREVCGLVFLAPHNELRLAFLRNHSRLPYQYRLSNGDIKLCIKRHAAENLKAIGIFHSHPVSQAKPGIGDLNAWPLHYLGMIYDVIGDEVIIWKFDRKRPSLKRMKIVTGCPKMNSSQSHHFFKTYFNIRRLLSEYKLSRSGRKTGRSRRRPPEE
jgi:proteasome lid subunit RPN8/RPN11